MNSFQNGSKFGRISMEDDRKGLHGLQDAPTPRTSRTLWQFPGSSGFGFRLQEKRNSTDSGHPCTIEYAAVASHRDVQTL
ncbi:hypothetical protein B9Z55_005741 [Caenorhabditis nigoni]|uniref:Uncharacterized protein n=1 Tax=Caenorhabditis nigoni TaxID=1611254 RepID=A0A2G5V296_9PELO|nr:hypothetical protein B9Z55_005741 [Caenorhabditis nigoni]